MRNPKSETGRAGRWDPAQITLYTLDQSFFLGCGRRSGRSYSQPRGARAKPERGAQIWGTSRGGRGMRWKEMRDFLEEGAFWWTWKFLNFLTFILLLVVFH